MKYPTIAKRFYFEEELKFSVFEHSFEDDFIYEYQ